MNKRQRISEEDIDTKLEAVEEVSRTASASHSPRPLEDFTSHIDVRSDSSHRCLIGLFSRCKVFLRYI